MKRNLLSILALVILGLSPISLSADCVEITISIDMSNAATIADLNAGTHTLWMRNWDQNPNTGATSVMDLLTQGGCVNASPPGTPGATWNFQFQQPFTESAANSCVFETTLQLDDQVNGGVTDVSYRYTLHVNENSTGIWAQKSTAAMESESGTGCYNLPGSFTRILTVSPGDVTSSEELSWNCGGNCPTCVPVTIKADMSSYPDVANLIAGTEELWLRSGNNSGTTGDIINSFPCITSSNAATSADFRNVAIFTHTSGTMFETTVFMDDAFNAGFFSYYLSIHNQVNTWPQRPPDTSEDAGACHLFANARRIVIPAAAATFCDEWNCLSALPVELLEFKGTPERQIVNLDWSTASELNNDYFVVEHSLTGERFTEVGMVNGNGTTQELSRYNFDHKNPVDGNNYYRLKQTDFDGAFEYSDVILVKMEKDAKVIVYPTIAQASIFVDAPNLEGATFSIITQTGQRLSLNAANFNGVKELDIAALPQGMYFLVIDQNGQTTTKRFIKQ